MSDKQISREQRRATSLRYVASLDGLRAIAALGVVIIHTQSASNASIGLYIFTGALAGPLFLLFFSISGFVLYRGWARRHMAMSERQPAAGSLKGSADGGADGRTYMYLVRRLLRIYPLYWVVATAALLVSDQTSGHSAMDIIQVYFLLPFPNLNALTDLGLGIVVWTLLIDIIFYVYVTGHAIAMTKLIKRFRRRYTPFQIESAVYIAMISVVLIASPFVRGPLVALACLPFGMWFAVIEAEQNRLGRRMAAINGLVDSWWLIPICYAILGPSLAYLLRDTKTHGEFLTNMFGVQLILTGAANWMMVVILFGNPNWPLQRFLTSKAIRVASLLTYGTYLWHPVVLMLLAQNLPDAKLVTNLAITVFGSVLLASITYVLVEKPLANMRIKMRQPEPVSANTK